MIRSLILLFLAVSTLLSCKPNQEKAFQSFFKEFQDSTKSKVLFQALLEKELFINDSILVEAKATEIQKVLDFSKEQFKYLNGLEKERLNINLQKDYDSAHHFLTRLINNIEKEKIHSSDPNFYSNIGFIKSLALQNDSSLSTNLKKLQTHYQIAIENLKTPSPEKLENVVSEGIAGYEYLDNEIKDYVLSLKLKKDKEKALLQELRTTQLGVKDYIAFCNSKIFDSQN